MAAHRPARAPPASAQATAAGGEAAAAAPAQPERGAKFRALKEKEAAAKAQQVPTQLAQQRQAAEARRPFHFASAPRHCM